MHSIERIKLQLIVFLPVWTKQKTTWQWYTGYSYTLYCIYSIKCIKNASNATEFLSSWYDDKITSTTFHQAIVMCRVSRTSFQAICKSNTWYERNGICLLALVSGSHPKTIFTWHSHKLAFYIPANEINFHRIAYVCVCVCVYNWGQTVKYALHYINWMQAKRSQMFVFNTHPIYVRPYHAGISYTHK